MLRRLIFAQAIFMLALTARAPAAVLATAPAAPVLAPVAVSAPPLSPVGPANPLRVGNAHLLPNQQTAAQMRLGQSTAATASTPPSNLSYNGGGVMHVPTVHVIFWLPSGYHFEPAGTAASDSQYEYLVNKFFGDVSGSPLYGLLSQYTDSAGPIQDTVHFAGSWVDTASYGHAGSTGDPLHDEDIQAEVNRAVASNHWQTGPDTEFFVYTALDIQSCSDPAGNFCTFSTSGFGGYCAYHSFVLTPQVTFTYANMADIDTCKLSLASPHNDLTVDMQISVTSHEFFESVTDPMLNAWTAPDGEEIGDLCAWKFGATDATGANVLLRPYSGYLVQLEWSNSARACELQLPPTVTYLTSREGPAGGGGTIWIEGAGLLGLAGQFGFSFGTYPVTVIGPCSQTECQVTVPAAHPASNCELVDVTATTMGLRSSQNVGDRFTYYASWPATSIDRLRLCYEPTKIADAS